MTPRPHLRLDSVNDEAQTVASPFAKMPFSVHGVLCALALLALWRPERLTEACSCAPVHPQQAFCNADVGEYAAGGGLFTWATNRWKPLESPRAVRGHGAHSAFTARLQTRADPVVLFCQVTLTSCDQVGNTRNPPKMTLMNFRVS